jgi:DNA-3-methyladenine glycosylase
VAVFLRAGEPLSGLDLMQARRPAAARERDLCRGPARLCQALGVDGAFDGSDLVTADRGVTIVDDGTPPPDEPANGTRIGLRLGADFPWRWWVPGDPHVSRPS